MTIDKLGFCREVEDEISRRKNATEREFAAHDDNIRKNWPEIQAVRQQITEIGIEFSDRIIASPQDTEALKKLASGLLEEKKGELRALLKANGFPEDYLERKPFCSVCGDTGFADGELCSCMKRLVISKRFSGSGLNSRQTFELFRHDLIDDPREARALERIYSYCLDYADSFPDNDLPDILLYGEPGVGKTFLLNAIGERVVKRGGSVLRLTAGNLINSVMDSIAERGPKPDLFMPDLLIIDDLGTEPMIPNVTIETLLSVLCERQDADKATLIATNKDVDSISFDYGSRIWSRLLSPQRVKVIKMTTPSIRLKKL